MDSKNFGFETLQIHAGQKPDATTKATGLPLYLSNAFTFDDANQAARIFALEEGGYFYSRLSNPTVDALQTRMAALDGGIGASGVFFWYSSNHGVNNDSLSKWR